MLRPADWVNACRHIGVAYLHLVQEEGFLECSLFFSFCRRQGTRTHEDVLFYNLALKMEGLHFFETLVVLHQSTWPNIPQDLNLQHQQKFKSRFVSAVLFCFVDMNSSNALCYLTSVSPVHSSEIFHHAMKKLAMNNTQTTRKPICLSDCNLPASLISLPSRQAVVFLKKGTLTENALRRITFRTRLFVRTRSKLFQKK
jgi:hypothetical protein